MSFGKNLRRLRKEKKLTQKELAEKLNLSQRTIISYEKGDSFPKDRDIYNKIADIFNIDKNYLLLDDDIFIKQASLEYGKSGKDEAMDLIKMAQALFAGGELDESDKDAVMRALQDAYWDGKREK